MRNILLIILTILTNSVGFSQVTLIPDSNFEQALIDQNIDSDGIINGQVATSDINSLVVLQIASKNITNLTGINDFASLQVLRVASNNLTSIDVSNLTLLTNLDAKLNNITTVNVSGCALLEDLYLNGNNLASLDVSNNLDLEYLSVGGTNFSNINLSNNTKLKSFSSRNTNLSTLDISNNQLLEILTLSNNNLTSLDLSNHDKIEELTLTNNDLTSLNVKNGTNGIINILKIAGNANLSCVLVDNATYSTTNWTTIDAQSYYSTTCSQTYVPDDNFEQTLIDLGYDNVLDDYVYTESINTLTSLDVSGKSILNANGIEDFVALETLDMSNNLLGNTINFSSLTQLESLNLSSNPSYVLSGETINISGCTLLEILNLEGNNFSSINVTNNTNLNYIDLRNNNLTSIDLSQNTSLVHLAINYNNLTTVDLTTNMNLERFYIGNNNLSSLNFKNGNNTIITNFNVTNNSGLACILVDNATYSTTNWTNIDGTSIFSETNCNTTYIPDDNFEQALIDAGIVSNATIDDYVLTQEIEDESYLNIGGKTISDLTGIEDFIALVDFVCASNNISDIDMSANTALQSIRCDQNPLTSLDISQNTNLNILRAYNTNLSQIDASNNPTLNTAYVYNNPNLSVLNLQNGNNSNLTGSNFQANNNPNLTCIQVDDALYSTTNWTTIDEQSFFSTASCDVTYVPDDNFEQRLINLGYDDVLNNYVLTSNVNSLTSIDLRFQGIVDMTGIEDFTALTQLQIQANNTIQGHLDLSNNVNLVHVYCDRNQITSIDVSTLTNLKILRAFQNEITTIDVSNNVQLDFLHLSDNLLENVDVNNNALLTRLLVNNNPNLNELTVKNGANVNITEFSATGNINLSCITVDDASASYLTTLPWAKDAGANFNEDCHYGQTYVPDDAFEQLLIDLNYDNVLDDYVLTSNINTVTVLGFDNTAIVDATGLEDFIGLEVLNIINNANLVSVDVSTLTQLIELTIEDTPLVFGLNNNLILEELTLKGNGLTSIDVTNNAQLNDLTISNDEDDTNFNDILTIDVSQNLLLTNLNLRRNTISSIGISMLSNLESLSISDNPLNSIDLLSNTQLINFSAKNTNLSNLDFSNNALLENVDLDDNVGITSLDFSANPALEYLDAPNCTISTINLANNINLKELILNDNGLTSIDLSNNINLDGFDLSNNSITAIDLSNNEGLKYVVIFDNDLEEFNFKNGANNSILLFIAGNNSNLTCIQVDDNEYSTANWTNIDVQTSFNEFCPEFYTYVPDDNFEQALIDLNLDDVLDDYVLTYNINTVTTLNLFNKGISDAAGIEGFTALVDLNLWINNLTAIDLSNNIALEVVNLSQNSLASLDVTNNLQLKELRAMNTIHIASLDLTNNTLLEELWVGYNKITSLNISNNTVLRELSIPYNLLANIDVSNNPQLTFLDVSNNSISSLDLSNNPLIESLYATDNNLTVINTSNLNALDTFSVSNNSILQIDLSNNPALTSVRVNDNNLGELNVKNGNNNPALSFFRATDNPNLTCIQVDDATWSTANWAQIDLQTSFSNFCGDPLVLSAKVYLQGAFLNPNAGEEHLMRDDLRVANLIPTTSPYADALTCTSTVLANSGDDAIVDWVWVELRDKNDNTSVLSSQSALLQRDGDVVATDGTSVLSINLHLGDYYVAINHRNHLGIMTINAISMSFETTTFLDFTDATNQITYGTDAQTTFGMPSGIAAIWSGDANGNGRLNYSGAASDISSIRSQVFNDPDNSVFGGPPVASYPSQGYNGTDVNMDGVTIYSGASSDVLLIRNNIFNNPSNSVFGGPPTSTYVFIQQLPEGAN